MKEQHTRARSPLEAALWEFRYQEKQWLAEKAALRRDAEAQRKQSAGLQHQLDRLQVGLLTYNSHHAPHARANILRGQPP